MKTYPKRICPFCSKEFTPTHPKQLVCKEDHYFPCPDCGKLVKVVDNSYAQFIKHGPKRCKECANKYSSEKRKLKSDEEKQRILEKRKQTNIKKFGVEFASQSKDIQKKIVETNLERYGVIRPLQNDEINKRRKQTNLERYGTEEAQRNDLVKDKVKQTLHERYGSDIDNVSQLDSTKQSVRETVRRKYGVDSTFQSEDVKEAIKKTNQERYGVSYPQQSKEIQEITKKNNLNKYGVEYTSQLDSVKEKSKQTCLETYGTKNPAQNDDIKAKIRSTNINNLGVPYPMMDEGVKQKSIETSMKRYGVPYHVQNLNTVERMILNPTKSENYYQFRKAPESFIKNHFDTSPKIYELEDLLGCTDTPIYDILVKNDCQNLIDRSISSMEKEILEFIKENYEGEVIHNDRNMISPYELDIYIPDKHFAIECNPTATHNSSFKDPWGGRPKLYNYHKMKTDSCERRGVTLFHAFEYEWKSKKEILKSMIMNVLGFTPVRLYARDTYVCEVSHEASKQFLEENHRQGHMTASVRLGLRCKNTDELVSLMTFNPTRASIGSKKGFEGVELSRFCSKQHHNVIGGASKLFKYFLEAHRYPNVVSFSDRAHTSGHLYEKLGFNKVSESEPGYVWVSLKDNSYYTRVACQKRNLRRLFNDPMIDIDNQTERQIMEAHGFAQVFDSGVIRWEYKNC